MQHKRAEFRGDSSVAGRRPVASVPRRVCLPLVQVAKQGNGLIASAELDGVRGNQDLPCFRRKDSTPQETAALRADRVDYGSATKLEFDVLCAPDNPHMAGMPPRLTSRDELFPARS